MSPVSNHNFLTSYCFRYLIEQKEGFKSVSHMNFGFEEVSSFSMLINSFIDYLEVGSNQIFLEIF